MPLAIYFGLLGGVIAAAALTVALAQWLGALAVLAPVPLLLAWLVRRA